MYMAVGKEFFPFGMKRDENTGTFHSSHVKMPDSVENHLNLVIGDIINNIENSLILFIKNPFEYLSTNNLLDVAFSVKQLGLTEDDDLSQKGSSPYIFTCYKPDNDAQFTTGYKIINGKNFDRKTLKDIYNFTDKSVDVSINVGDYIAISTKKQDSKGFIKRLTFLYQVLDLCTMNKDHKYNILECAYDIAKCSLAFVHIEDMQDVEFENFDDEYITEERVKMFKEYMKK